MGRGRSRARVPWAPCANTSAEWGWTVPALSPASARAACGLLRLAGLRRGRPPHSGVRGPPCRTFPSRMRSLRSLLALVRRKASSFLCKRALHTRFAHGLLHTGFSQSFVNELRTRSLHTSSAQELCTRALNTSFVHELCTRALHTSFAHELLHTSFCTRAFHTSFAYELFTYRGQSQRPIGLGPGLVFDNLTLECRKTFTSAVTCPYHAWKHGKVLISTKKLMKKRGIS